MFTSYFANLINVKNPLSICGKAPEWYQGPQFKTLAPKYDFFAAYKRGDLDEAGYVVEFKKRVLDNLNPIDIYQRLIKAYGDDVTLLCYEKPHEFCHRHIVSQWLAFHNTTVIEELERPEKRTTLLSW